MTTVNTVFSAAEILSTKEATARSLVAETMILNFATAVESKLFIIDSPIARQLI